MPRWELLASYSSPRSVHAGALAQGLDRMLLPRDLSPWGMFLNADIVVKAVMVGLAFASLVTWTVWLAKTDRAASRERARAARGLAVLDSGAHACATRARACGATRCRRAARAAAAAKRKLSAASPMTASRNASPAAGARRGRDAAADRRAAPACSPPSARPRPSSACSARSGAS